MVAEVPYNTYTWLGDNRAEVSSWAVWEQPPAELDPEVGLTTDGIGEVGFFEVSDEDEYWGGIGQALRRDVVVIGLNPAAREDERGARTRDSRLFGCFHDEDSKKVKDHRLRAIAYHWGLWGAHIADLDAITVETSSKIAMDKLLSEPEHRTKCANMLAETFGRLDPPRDALVVLLGDSVQKGSLLPEFREVFDRFFEVEPRKIWHYSHRCGLQNRITNAQNVLGDQQDISSLWVPGRTAAQA